MLRIAVGLGLVAGAAYFGRRTSSGLSAPPRSFLERGLDDIGQFALTQFPREEIRAGDSPLYRDPEHRMQCAKLEPYLAAATRHIGEALTEEEDGAEAAIVLLAQAWSAAAQPGLCQTLRMPRWLIE